MFAKPEFIEYGKRIGTKNFPRRVPGKKREQDRNQSAHNMGIAVSEIFQ